MGVGRRGGEHFSECRVVLRPLYWNRSFWISTIVARMQLVWQSTREPKIWQELSLLNQKIVLLFAVKRNGFAMITAHTCCNGDRNWVGVGQASELELLRRGQPIHPLPWADRAWPGYWGKAFIASPCCLPVPPSQCLSSLIQIRISSQAIKSQWCRQGTFSFWDSVSLYKIRNWIKPGF